MLTEAECKNAICPPDKKQARFADSGGMYLQVSPAGSKRWFLKYRVGGKEKQLALGSYPDVSLKSARLARDAAKLQKKKKSSILISHMWQIYLVQCQDLVLIYCNAVLDF